MLPRPPQCPTAADCSLFAYCLCPQPPKRDAHDLRGLIVHSSMSPAQSGLWGKRSEIQSSRLCKACWPHLSPHACLGPQQSHWAVGGFEADGATEVWQVGGLACPRGCLPLWLWATPGSHLGSNLSSWTQVPLCTTRCFQSACMCWAWDSPEGEMSIGEFRECSCVLSGF
jgi:hypothetical protein